MTTMYVVMDIGCFECGVGTEPVGIYTTEQEAEAAAKFINKRDKGWREGGQSDAMVFPMRMGDMFVRTIDGSVVEPGKELL